MEILELTPHLTEGSRVDALGENHWRLSCPGGKAGKYCLAQLDDTQGRKRSDLRWSVPCQLQLEARASSDLLPGTWGFGFWNDPFGMKLGFGGERLLPALPEAAWFFMASEPNYLSFRSDLPAVGSLAAVFRSSALPVWLLVPMGVTAPLLVMRWFSRLARRFAATIVREESHLIDLDLTEWHCYQLIWEVNGVRFLVDGEIVKQAVLSPRSPLGLVLWVDNQYAAWRPNGTLKYGTLETDPRWIEIRNLTIG